MKEALKIPTVIPIEPRGDHLPRVEIGGQTLEPQAERTLLWIEAQTLFIADLHLGKAATFRDHAIPIPTGTTRDDLDRLSRSIVKTGARRLIVLGDLFHSISAQDQRFFDMLVVWKADHPTLELCVVPGNHDAHAGRPPTGLGWNELVEGHVEGPFGMRHHPSEMDGVYVLAGHLHPKFSIRDGRESVRLPCFHFRQRGCVLPAFGSFTGGVKVKPRREEHVYVPVDDAVIKVR